MLGLSVMVVCHLLVVDCLIRLSLVRCLRKLIAFYTRYLSFSFLDFFVPCFSFWFPYFIAIVAFLLLFSTSIGSHHSLRSFNPRRVDYGVFDSVVTDSR